ncbi:MAG: hypothetical protein BWY99_02837 [Synergistetes bacterium ADurb.BinA166]|nr:MAG: hypothetical protein BWY99_02837 [Synergistetes bacterium ADurb.BinA166]
MQRVRGGEPAGGLVHEEHRRFPDEFQSDVEAFSLPSADGLVQGRSDTDMGDVELVQAVEHPFAAAPDLCVRKVRQSETRAVVQIFEDGEILEEKIVLRNIPQNASPEHRVACDVASVEQQPPGARPKLAREQREQRRFSGAAPSHYRDKLASPHGEAEVVKAGVGGAVVAEVQMISLEDVGAGRCGEGGERGGDLAEVDAVPLPVRDDRSLSQAADTAVEGNAVQKQCSPGRGPDKPRPLFLRAEDRERPFELRTAEDSERRGARLLRGGVRREEKPVVESGPVPRE